VQPGEDLEAVCSQTLCDLHLELPPPFGIEARPVGFSGSPR
jgi:hypothetical protein